MTSRQIGDFEGLLTKDTSVLERPVAIQPYHSFNKLRIEDGIIKRREATTSVVLITPSIGMLEKFVALADAEADADENRYLEYACKWGLLDLCKEHFMPTSHNYNCEPIVCRTIVYGTAERAAKERQERLVSEGEPISAWKDYAQFARAILRIAARLHEGKMGADEDWKTLHSVEFMGWNHAERRKASKGPELDHEKSLIASGVNYWLEIGSVQPSVSWKASRPIITFQCPKPYGKLFANLAIQLMMAVSQIDSLAICSACGRSYMPKHRRPKNNQRRYCPDCKKVSWRDAQADCRRRKRAAS